MGNEAKEVTVVDVGEVYGKSGDRSAKKGIETGWKNPPKLSDLKADKQLAKEKHDAVVTKIHEWLDALYVRGKYGVKKRTGRSGVSPKLIRRTIEWKTPSLSEPFLNTKALFEVSPRTWDDSAAAAQNEVILNYQIKNKINLVDLMDNITRAIETEGTAVLKPSWNYKSNLVRKKELVYDYTVDERLHEVYGGLIQRMQQEPELIDQVSEEVAKGLEAYVETGEPRAYFLVEEIEVETEKVTHNHPDVEVCDNENVFPDPTCKGNINKCRYIVHDYEVTLADLKEAGIYKNLDEVALYEASKERNNRSTKADSSRKQIEVSEYWGYWDINNDGVLTPIVASWVGDVLIQLEISPYESGKLPFVFIRLNSLNKDSLFGEAEAENIGESQQILGAILRGTIDLMGKSAAGQRGFAKNFLDAANKEKFRLGEDYEYARDADPEKDIYQHTYPNLPNSVIPLLQYANNEADAMSGTQAFSQGLNSGSLGTVAAGMKTAVSAAAKRETGILRRIAQGLVDISYFFVEMNSTFLTEDDVVRLTSKEFQQVDPDNLSGDFDLVLDIATSESDANNIANLTMLLQVGQTVLPFDYTKKILIEIARLARLYELAQFIEEYEPEPDPVQQQRDQFELQKMQLENDEIAARIEVSRAEAAVKWAEVGVRESRADNLQSNTDKTSIGNYKELNGQTQQERLEAQERQAESKQRLEDQKHLNSIDSKRFDHNAGLKRGLAESQLPRNNGQ